MTTHRFGKAHDRSFERYDPAGVRALVESTHAVGARCGGRSATAFARSR